MSRPARLIFPTTILALALTLAGCKTLYSDTYSPRRNRFKPLPPKMEKVDEAPPISDDAALAPLTPAAPAPLGLPEAAPAPAIPGL